MVLIELKDDTAKFLCPECNRIIATGQNFLINPKNFLKSEIIVLGDRTYYICKCGSRFELIKSSNPEVKDFLKFKHVRVVEQEYTLK